MKTTVNVNFTKNNTNKKDEVVLEFQVRGELSDEQVVKLARLKSAGAVVVDIRTSQTDIDDYYHETPREGIRGTINSDGSINVETKEEGQVTIEEVGEQREASETTEPSDQEQQSDEAAEVEEQESSEESEDHLPDDAAEEQETTEEETEDEEQPTDEYSDDLED
jgi:phosphosulfolactate synthase (CoM biosynthesis protein A)